MSLLSDRQQRILEYIISIMKQQDFPPSIREIGQAVGISSTSVVNYNLAKLEELDLLSRRKEVSRGLTLNWDKLPSFGFRSNELASEDVSVEVEGTMGNGFFPVPVLGPIAAGEPIQVDPAEPATTDHWVKVDSDTHSSSDKLFALQVQGDSMIDASVLNGDIVVLRSQETANNGEMVAAWIEGDEETTLKYLYKEGKTVRLQPANPNYPPIIRDAGQVQIKGKVISVIRTLN